ncbi:MAG: MFS transporter [Clostridia bacterium]|nr:MFS transporter [Clostridia bacterium]
MEKNVKLFPFYKLFSYDILFYYAINVIFFSQSKGLSLSEIALFSTAYSIAAIVFQIPAAIIAEKLGTKLSMIIGNILCLTWGLNLIISNSFELFIIGEVILALGFSLKGVTESPFLLSSLKKLNRADEFAKTESKGSVLYFLIEAIACIAAGYLYKANEYLPIIFACICCLISTCIAFSFNKINKSAETVSSQKYFSDLKAGFKYIFKSKRLHALLLFTCVFYGVISSCNVLMKSYFAEFGLSPEGFGYVYAVFAIFAALGSKIQNILEKKFKNKTLQFFSTTYLFLVITAGIIAMFNFKNNVIINAGIILFAIQQIFKGSYRIIIKQYITRYTTSTIRSKLMSIYYLSEHLGAAIFTSLISVLLANFKIGMTCTITGFLLFIIILFVLQFMESRVGLSPDKYTTRDRIDLLEQTNAEQK